MCWAHRAAREPAIRQPLRGRTGPPGRPGPLEVFLSCEDDPIAASSPGPLILMKTFGVQEARRLRNKWLNSAIATASEGRAAQLRDPQEPSEDDDVVNDQRKAVFEQRHRIHGGADVRVVTTSPTTPSPTWSWRHLPPKAMPSKWDVEGLSERVRKNLGLDLPIADWRRDGHAHEEIEPPYHRRRRRRAAERRTAGPGTVTRRREELPLCR